MAARDAAKENGYPYGTILTTTAGRQNTPEGAFAFDTYNKGLRWDEAYFDLETLEDYVELLKKNSKNSISIIDLSHRQLGYTDEWLRDKLIESGATGLDAEADYLNRWVKGTDASPITPELLEMMNDSVMTPTYTEIGNQGYVLRWYKTEAWINANKDKELIVGLDTSDAVGKDGIGLTIVDVRTGETLAAGGYNETNVISFSNWLVDLLLKYPKLTLIIERRSTGTAILDNMMLMLEARGVDPFKRIFNWVVNNAGHSERDKKKFDEINTRSSQSSFLTEKNRKSFGFATSGTGVTSRTGLYGNTLQNAVKYTGGNSRDKQLVTQLSNLTVRNGRIDHAIGGHDDLVIAWLLCHWFLTTAGNREHYGIEDGRTLTQLVVNNSLTTSNLKAKEKADLSRKFKEDLDNVLAALKTAKMYPTINKLTIKAKLLNAKLEKMDGGSLDLETVLDNLKRDRSKDVNKARYFDRRRRTR